jgi:D-alanyl-D-alanine carboxypeptidase (penicillin-binding protein 5/6)
VKVTRRVLIRATAGAVALGLIAAGATVAVRRIAAPLAPVTASVTAPSTLVAAPGTTLPIPLPPSGSLAIASERDGILAALDADHVRPIGSIAKTMTALVVLAARPLARGEPGPELTLMQDDVDLYHQAIAEGGSAIRVHTGETLSERDLLLALMLPSANNIAETLARWVAGDRVTFISLLNSEAARLHMSATTFADPSGFSAATQSTASDLLALARAALSNPALADIVATQKASLPDGTVLENLDILLDQPQWLGIKTGWTSQAGGCLLFAARQEYAPATAAVTVWGAVLGQPPLAVADPKHPELGAAFQAAKLSTTAALQSYEAVDVGSLEPNAVGSISTPWGANSSVHAGPAAVHVSVPMRAGTTLRLRVVIQPERAPLPGGTRVGMVIGELGGRDVDTWPLITLAALDTPSLWWKLFSAP